MPIEVLEMNSAAKLILERIEYLDSAQYKSLLKSIGETTNEEDPTIEAAKELIPTVTKDNSYQEKEKLIEKQPSLFDFSVDGKQWIKQTYK